MIRKEPMTEADCLITADSENELLSFVDAWAGKSTPTEPSSKPTKFGQQLLDLLCDHVAPVCEMGFVTWSIGKEPEIVRWLAAKLDRSIKSIAGGIADLVEKGFLNSGKGLSEGCLGSAEKPGREDAKTAYNIVAMTHEGWQQYSRFDTSKLFGGYGDDLSEPDCTVEDWLDWDGVDGMPCPFGYDLPEWRVERTAKTQHDKQKKERLKPRKVR